MKIVNKKRFFGFIAAVICVGLMSILVVDFIRFPECYLPTWKYQLHNDIKKGDEMAIEYYENQYVKNNRILFEEVK